VLNHRYFSFEKGPGTQKSDAKFGWRGVVVPEHRFGLYPSEKELPERRSGMFGHRNTPGVDLYELSYNKTPAY
jgi:hypothetical protein